MTAVGPRSGTLVGTEVDALVCLVGRHCRKQCVALQLQCTHWRGPVVDDQITVRLPTSLGRTLRRTSRRMGRRPSDVVRMALEAFLQGAPSADHKPAERVDHLIGSLSSGVPDLAERHRDYVLAALKHAR
jgi:Arc/MetJ-type ribon-helix-helix transcriptional regulator